MMAPTLIATAQPGVKLRFARHGDAALVLSFIRELADYEQLPHEVAADIELLSESLFGDMPAAEVVIAEVDGVPRPPRSVLGRPIRASDPSR